MSGGKYGSSKRRKTERVKREVKRRLDDQSVPRGSYSPPLRNTTESVAPTILALSETTRILYQFWYVDNEMVEFVILHFVQLERKLHGWYQLARVDCKHGAAHIHVDDDGASHQKVRNLHTLDSRQDLWDAFDKSYEEVIGKWQMRERWFEGELGSSSRNRPTGRLPEASGPNDCS